MVALRVWCDPVSSWAIHSDNWWVCQQDSWWVTLLWGLSSSRHHNRPDPIVYWNKFESPTDMCRRSHGLWCNGSMGSCSTYFWLPNWIALRWTVCRARRQIWPITATSNTAAAMPSPGQSIYFLYSIRVERGHKCRAWAIHASTEIRLVCLQVKREFQRGKLLMKEECATRTERGKEG